MGGTRHGLNATNHSVYRLVDFQSINQIQICLSWFGFLTFFGKLFLFSVRESELRTKKRQNMEAKRYDLGKMP